MILQKVVCIQIETRENCNSHHFFADASQSKDSFKQYSFCNYYKEHCTLSTEIQTVETSH